MGCWGTGLYQNDVAEDVKLHYEDALKRGQDEPVVTQQLLQAFSHLLNDRDDGPVFWCALADTQWNWGRLDDFVKAQAQHYIKNDIDSSHWETSSLKQKQQRKAVLKELEVKLSTPQPAAKKAKPIHIYKCSWQINDVYAYPLVSDYATLKGVYGEYFVFQKIGETTWYPGHVVPIVRVKITTNGVLPNNTDEFDSLKYVQISVAQPDLLQNRHQPFFVDDGGNLPNYQLILVNTSSKIIPKNLVYLGNFPNTQPPINENIYDNAINIPGFMWKNFDKILIDRYCHFEAKKKSNS